MKTLPLVITLFLLFFIPRQALYAQYFYDENNYNTPLIYEAGASLGFMNCLTDMGGSKGLGGHFIKDVNMGNNQLCGTWYFNAVYKEAIGIRLEGTIGSVKAYDSILKSVQLSTSGRYERNLSFKSDILEVSLLTEIYPLFIFIDWQNRESSPPKISPYLLGGIGFFSFNPTTILQGKQIDLQPLSTEGQGFSEYSERKRYKLQQINFPVGAGIKYELSATVNLRAEGVYRILSTDYLDDVSTNYIDPALYAKYFIGTQLKNAIELNDRRSKTNPAYPVSATGGQVRGNAKNNDAYFTFNLKIGVTFGREKIRH